MTLDAFEQEEKKVGKKLYDYQHAAMDQIFDKINAHESHYNLLYQLPTGGGKTVIFTEIAKQYIKKTGKKVLILTHRIELCGQTSDMLKEFGVNNKIVNSRVKELEEQNEYMCYVAMVETLNNRLQDEKISFDNLGLVIVDEAHYNSFRKLYKYFESSFLLGVTATPLSSNIKLPMRETFDSLIVGDSIPTLIERGFLAEATTISYDVGLTSLKIGVNGDYTVSSSERLYTDFDMQAKLLHAYEESARGKKTLIFNNGIQTSKEVHKTFLNAGYPIRHLDNKNSKQERAEIIKWFKETPDAILTSVGILTTGFDEPSVEAIILNRATKSLTLYFQMIGRGSRITKTKKQFSIIDLGNNAARFGLWNAPTDWYEIFKNPDYYIQSIASDEEIERNFNYKMPKELRDKFSNTEEIDINIKLVYEQIVAERKKPKEVIDIALTHHEKMILENSKSLYEAKSLIEDLEEDIKDKVKHYSNCLASATPNYKKWLYDEYLRKLKHRVSQRYMRY